MSLRTEIPKMCTGRLGIAQQLLQNRADIIASSNEGCTPLHKAAAGGHGEVVRMILSAAGPLVSQLVSSRGFLETLAGFNMLLYGFSEYSRFSISGRLFL